MNGGVVCPNLHRPVEFTCVGVEVNFLEWQRNGNSINVFTSNSNEGKVLQEGPFTLFLDSIIRSGGGTRNMTSRLVVNVSDLTIGDRITCIENMDTQDRMDTVTLEYMLRGN